MCRAEISRRICGEMNECETIWALVNVSVQSSLVFLRHYKLHLSLAHSLRKWQSVAGCATILLLLLLLRSCCCLSVQNVIFNGACICLSSGLYYIYDENPSAIPILNILPYSLTFRPKTATTKAPMTMSTEHSALSTI